VVACAGGSIDLVDLSCEEILVENGVIGCMGDAWCVGGEEGLIGGVLGPCGELLKLGVVSEPAETVGNWLIFDKKDLCQKGQGPNIQLKMKISDVFQCLISIISQLCSKNHLPSLKNTPKTHQNSNFLQFHQVSKHFS
jgi:hypothetical protein